MYQENHYYPFGMAMEGNWENVVNAPENRYLYNGKELQSDFGLDWLDYGARFYDPAIGRWNAVDPLAADFAAWSTYSYVFNNPLSFIDPDGRAPEWVPRISSTGNVQLVAEQGDNLQTLKEYFSGSTKFSDSQLEAAYNSAKGGVIVDLPSDNYSDAFQYANDNSDDFYSIEQEQEMSWDESRSTTNYNCYHFCVNGAWEKDIYSFWGSYGDYMMEPESFKSVLDEYFTPVAASEAIYGETIITMNNSGGYPMHSAVYGGTDKKGNIYVMEKYGGHEAPRLQKLSDDYSDIQFYNEN